MVNDFKVDENIVEMTIFLLVFRFMLMVLKVN